MISDLMDFLRAHPDGCSAKLNTKRVDEVLGLIDAVDALSAENQKLREALDSAMQKNTPLGALIRDLTHLLADCEEWMSCDEQSVEGEALLLRIRAALSKEPK